MQAELKAKGVDEVLVYCVNDACVMQAWGKDQGVENSMVSFMADPKCEFTRALGEELVLSGVEPLGNDRCKRFSMLVEGGVIKALTVAADGVPDEQTFAEAVVTQC